MGGISGFIAGGAQDALAEVLDRRLKELARQQQEQQAAAQLDLQRQQLASVDADRALGRDLQRQTIDLANLRRVDEQAQAATDRNVGLDAANVLNMPGMTPQAKANELQQSVLRNPNAASSPGMLRIIEGLTKVPDKKFTSPQRMADGTIQQFEEGNIPPGARFYQEPKNAPAPARRQPEWVQQSDGSVIDINGVAPAGTRPVTATSITQQTDKTAANERAVAAMKAYGDDMLAVIDSLIDADGNLKPEVTGVIGGIDGARPEWAYLTEGSQGALANIDRLQSMLNINTLADMKAQSRTGATGFGSLTERELNVVESSASKLRRRRQADAEYAAELRRLRDTLTSGRGGQRPAPDVDPATAAALALIEKARAGRRPGG